MEFKDIGFERANWTELAQYAAVASYYNGGVNNTEFRDRRNVCHLLKESSAALRS
jgi:hypothetical protein